MQFSRGCWKHNVQKDPADFRTSGDSEEFQELCFEAYLFWVWHRGLYKLELHQGVWFEWVLCTLVPVPPVLWGWVQHHSAKTWFSCSWHEFLLDLKCSYPFAQLHLLALSTCEEDSDDQVVEKSSNTFLLSFVAMYEKFLQRICRNIPPCDTTTLQSWKCSKRLTSPNRHSASVKIDRVRHGKQQKTPVLSTTTRSGIAYPATRPLMRAFSRKALLECKLLGL